MIDTQTQSTQVPSPSSSKTLSINLKRKIPRPSFDLFAKRLRKAVTAIEPVYFDPSTATLILRSRLEDFILDERKKAENHGELHPDPYPYSTPMGLWACIGAFNFIINDEEQFGGKKGGPSSTNYLKELLFELNAVDLGYSGNKFTWARGKWGNSAIRRRLDKGVANISWRLAYLKATITHLGAIKSDHAPILLDTNPCDSFAHRPFRFEAIWLRNENCSAVIENA
nr:hypothetical protein CFP56_65080 [Quercus suber]